MVRSLFETNSACAWQTEGNIFGIKYLGWILNGQKVILKMCENSKAVANKFPQTFLNWLPYCNMLYFNTKFSSKNILYKFQFSVNLSYVNIGIIVNIRSVTKLLVFQGIYENILNFKSIANFCN